MEIFLKWCHTYLNKCQSFTNYDITLFCLDFKKKYLLMPIVPKVVSSIFGMHNWLGTCLSYHCLHHEHKKHQTTTFLTWKVTETCENECKPHLSHKNSNWIIHTVSQLLYAVWQGGRQQSFRHLKNKQKNVEIS